MSAFAHLPVTARLYHGDSWLLAFDGQVLGHGSWEGQPSLILDRTAFYPESGGQMADHGVLGGLDILDVQVDDSGHIHHVVAAGTALPAVGSSVHGTIERSRRRIHMAQHTGQHMLSRALADVARAATVSSRLGETACTIDVDRDAVPERELSAAEDLVNSLIEDDLVVRAFFPEPEELAALPLRKVPSVETDVRVVAIGEFDVSPCGGTHTTRTAQVGLVRITGATRYKGMTRVTFAAGRRARAELVGHAELVGRLAAELTCGPSEIPIAMDKLRRELAAARTALGDARKRLAESAAMALLGPAGNGTTEQHVVAAFPDSDAEFLRAVAARIIATGARVALLAAPGPEGVQVLVARGPESRFDCGAFLKRVATLAGGRGGGRPERAEGRLPASADWVALVAAAEA